MGDQQDNIVLDPTLAAFAPDSDLKSLGVTHFIGIGGAGMSVLAEMLHEHGVNVQGSDRAANAKTQHLQDAGVTVFVGQDAHNVEGADTVVYSSAIKPDNPEIVAAAERGANIVHRSDILALLMSQGRAVTVAGAHGKSTTSSLLAHILRTGGAGQLADPSYAIGASIQGPDSTTLDGGHAGAGDVLVAEADESDGSFAKYRPTIAIITNAEADHLDHYGTAERYHAAFVDHAGHAVDHVIMCVDDEGARKVLRALDPRVAERTIAYTTATRSELGDLNGAMLVEISSEQEDRATGVERFVLDLPARLTGEARVLPVELSIPGLHNARNATAAIIAAILLGMDPDVAAQSAHSFLGAARRFQIRGQQDGVTVVDDYAHHPTEIAALLDATRRRYPDASIRVLFQPHLFSRTKFFAPQFAKALDKADDVIVTGIFPAREKQEDFPDITAQTIVDEAKRLGDGDDWISAEEDMALAAQMMAMRAESGDVILTVGAGDITKMAPVVLHALEARFSGNGQ